MMFFVGFIAILSCGLLGSGVEGRLDLSPPKSNGNSYYCVGPDCTQHSNDVPLHDEPLNCQNGSMRIDRTDCHYYYICLDGVHWTREQCPTDHAWSPSWEFCTKKEYVNCETRCRPDGRFGDYNDCHNYYECVHGFPFKHTCGNGTIFDEVVGQCVLGTCEN